jgi:hypothetical protein
MRRFAEASRGCCGVAELNLELLQDHPKQLRYKTILCERVEPHGNCESNWWGIESMLRSVPFEAQYNENPTMTQRLESVLQPRTTHHAGVTFPRLPPYY